MKKIHYIAASDFGIVTMLTVHDDVTDKEIDREIEAIFQTFTGELADRWMPGVFVLFEPN